MLMALQPLAIPAAMAARLGQDPSGLNTRVDSIIRKCKGRKHAPFERLHCSNRLRPLLLAEGLLISVQWFFERLLHQNAMFGLKPGHISASWEHRVSSVHLALPVYWASLNLASSQELQALVALGRAFALQVVV